MVAKQLFKMAPPDLKKMLQVNIKPRQDSYTDQFSRIFMVKMMMLTSAVTAISWMKDKVNLFCVKIIRQLIVTGDYGQLKKIQIF